MKTTPNCRTPHLASRQEGHEHHLDDHYGGVEGKRPEQLLVHRKDHPIKPRSLER